MKLRRIPLFLMVAAWPGYLTAQITAVSFLQPRTFGSGWAQSIAVADFNGDGAMDAATIGPDLTIYLGNGHGSFTAQPGIGLYGTAIVTADFNEDGAADLAIASPAGLTVLLGNGDGTFQAPTSYPGSFTLLAIGDFNGDHVPDIAAANSSAQVEVFFGRFAGFQPGPLTTLPTGNAVSMAAADFNGDGRTDLAVTGVSGSFRGVAVLLASSSGTFANPTIYAVTGAKSLTSLTTADFNGDGKADLAYAAYLSSSSVPYTVRLLLNQGNGTFSAGMPVEMQADVVALGTADLNGDGITDLVAMANGLADILVGRGNGTFRNSGNYVFSALVSAIAIADCNGDGLPDLMAANNTVYTTGAPLSVMLATGGGRFQSSRAYNAGQYPSGLAAADFNGDGKLDLVVSDNRPTNPVIAVSQGNGNGGFGPPVNYPANNPGPLAVGDANGDGKLDVVFVGYDSVGTLPGNGDGTFGLAIYSPCLGCQGALVMEDVNGDGRLDLITWEYDAQTGSQYLVLLLGKGDGTFLPPTNIMHGSPGLIESADFNNDGYPDLVVSTTGGIYTLLNNGQGGFSSPILLALFGALGALGDFNGDGNIDIAMDLPSGFQTGIIYFGNGNGTFVPGFAINAPGTPAIAGDFNGDGILDLMGADELTGLGFVLLGDGNGNFVRQNQDFVFPPATAVIVAADFNGDGKLDLAMFDYGSPIWVLLNTTH